jgi:lipoprotein-anchoring transpeptidase ErfK/SrfK
MMRTATLVAAVVLCACIGGRSARAEIVAEISISEQRMTVRIDGATAFIWPVSTARRGYVTPKGTFKVQSMHKMTYSRLFNNAPMPYTIFYDGHYGIHGTTEVRRLGQPASAGCVRLHPDNARVLFDLVKERGPQELQVVVEG